MPFTPTYRSVKGADLTPTEEEDNHRYHVQERDDLQTQIDGIGTIDLTLSVSGNVLSYTYNGVTTALASLPIPALNPRGDWAAATAYTRNDLVFRIGVGLILVVKSHTSPAAFDLAHQESGENVYRRLAPSESSYDFGFVIDTAPAAGEVIARIPCVRDYQIPADFTGSDAAGEVNPAATYVISLRVNNVEVGTITISSGGTVTWETVEDTGGAALPVTVSDGDVVTVVAPDDGTAQDTSIAGWAFVILADLIAGS